MCLLPTKQSLEEAAFLRVDEAHGLVFAEETVVDVLLSL